MIRFLAAMLRHTHRLFWAVLGRRYCRRCDGYGAIARLDAGYMRKFGLREWDGCEACGGTREQRGTGWEVR